MSSRVNQKLYFSKLALESARAQTGQPQLAELEAATLHLAVAYRAHLAEIAAHYNERLQEGEHAAELIRRLAARSVHIAELEQLAELERNGWVATLLRLGERTLSPHAEASSAAVSPRSGIGSLAIPLVQLDGGASADEVNLADPERAIELLAGWQQALTELVAAQRQLSQEW